MNKEKQKVIDILWKHVDCWDNGQMMDASEEIAQLNNNDWIKKVSDWLMVNTDLHVSKIVDLKEHFEPLKGEENDQ